MMSLPIVLVGLFVGACSWFREEKKSEEEAEDTAGPGKCSKGYCEIPGGSFQMGSTRISPSDEQPVKNVTMTGFQLGQTEVSVGQYLKFLAKSDILLKAVIVGFPENVKGDDYPVVGLTYDEKRAYCQSQGGDLPTAAQLHFASRYDLQDSATGGKDRRVVENGFGPNTEPVKGGYKNRFGIFNLLGNVWERTRDRYEEDFYSRMASQDPYNPLTNQSTQKQEFSGGGHRDPRLFAHPAMRSGGPPDHRYDGLGFRCARPLPQDSKK